MSVYGQQELLVFKHPKIRFRNYTQDAIMMEFNIGDNTRQRWEPVGYLHGLYSTCSTVYIGQLDSIRTYLGTVEEILRIIQKWAFNHPYANYTEIMCTLRTDYLDLVEEVKREGFIPLGEPFVNLRTEHELQHFILRRVK